MELAITEQSESITGLKKACFINAVNRHIELTQPINNLWVSTLYTDKGVSVGWFCNFSDEDGHEYHLQNDKGVVRVFRTVEAAISFYSDCNTCSVSVGWG